MHLVISSAAAPPFLLALDIFATLGPQNHNLVVFIPAIVGIRESYSAEGWHKEKARFANQVR
jgi:hypothetical protein